jgi:hypothetical protein
VVEVEKADAGGTDRHDLNGSGTARATFEALQRLLETGVPEHHAE